MTDTELVDPKNGWKVIADDRASVPTDDRLFMVGMWYGPTIWDAEKCEHVFIGKPEWIQAISHAENPSGPHGTRGWNHRNGPLRGDATHWRSLPEPPLFTGFYFEKVECP